ncbi:MAG TPA: SpoIIE family protein phosphatase [Bryobacteraceae bacterium]|jgi:serine phosphatase RsbU (regulator of sigma subunit)
MSLGATLSDTAPATPAPASLIVVDPNGQRTRVDLAPLPFNIGRQAGNHFIVRDSRASRVHARIVAQGMQYWIEDNGSRHGVFVNGVKVSRQPLKSSDRIDFGISDSYHFYFALNEDADRILQPSQTIESSASHLSAVPRQAGAGQNLPKLRAVLEVARTLQRSFSLDDVLNSVIDAALAVTGAERGFLLLNENQELHIRCARDQHSRPLSHDELRVPRRVIHRALKNRRELLAMNFDPTAGDDPSSSVADLELRSVVCVPLVRVAATAVESTQRLTVESETVGVLYLDSRSITADLSGGNRELLQTLAIEASTVLENARLLQEERLKQKLEEELNLARTIQQNLLPRSLPSTGWFRACGSSVASHQVGGDYFDVLPVSDECWAIIVADVSGKGVSSALLASLLQGAFLAASDSATHLEGVLERINAFLNLRPEAEKYATVFCALIRQSGEGVYINAGHCSPIIVHDCEPATTLNPTTFPVGLVEGAEYRAESFKLERGDKLVAYTDGVSEAQNAAGEFFGVRRLNDTLKANGRGDCEVLHQSIRNAVAGFTEGAAQSDDITLLILGYEDREAAR